MFQTVQAYVMFSDIKGFSKLLPEELTLFASHIWPESVQGFVEAQQRGELLVLNSWGDALIAVFTDPQLVEVVLGYRDFFRINAEYGKQLRKLRVRIACHYGEVMTFHDPATGKSNVLGKDINLAARLEPVTRPGFVFATAAFRDAVAAGGHDGLAFDDLGKVALPKKFGETHVFTVRRRDEKQHIIDLLQRERIAGLLDTDIADPQEQEQLAHLRACSAVDLQAELHQALAIASPSFLAALAEVCTSKGLYAAAVELADQAASRPPSNGDLELLPDRNDVRLLKTKANALSRLKQYGEAIEVLHHLWALGNRDSDTLSMLAAQHKRQAFHDDEGLHDPDQLRGHLRKARDLYLEAFLGNLDDYYPAINAAYLSAMLGGGDAHKGRTLARHIRDTWTDPLPGDWWLRATLAECSLIDGDYETARQELEAAVAQARPSVFELESTLNQIRLFRSRCFDPAAEEEIDRLIDWLAGVAATTGETGVGWKRAIWGVRAPCPGVPRSLA